MGLRRLRPPPHPSRIALPISKEFIVMAKQCEVCGKTPVFGNQVSHAHNITSRRWLPNLQRVRVLVNGAARRMNVCTRCIRSNRVQKAVR
jgi:large subunit ribosomal protein L28